VRLRRGEIVDWYVERGESAVLIEDHVLVLSPLATRLLEVLGSGWLPIDVAVERLVDHFGEPPSGTADALTRETVDVLAEWGVVLLDESPAPT
jgi:hypothetical protein